MDTMFYQLKGLTLDEISRLSIERLEIMVCETHSGK